MDPATKKENVLAFLIDMKIVAKAAEDKKIEDRDDFKARLAFTRNRLLMDNLLASEGKAATTDEAMKKVYEDAAKQIAGEQEVHARHILVETEDEAKAIEAELKKGADFAELAKKKSKDPGASDGGDLGFFTKDQMVPEFSAVAFALEPGKISDPVKSQFGWHVIKVEEKRNRKAPDFEQVKRQIETYVTRKAQAEYVAKLREAAKVERMDQAANDAGGEAGRRQAGRLQDGAGEEVKIRCHFFEANSIYAPSMAGLVPAIYVLMRRFARHERRGVAGSIALAVLTAKVIPSASCLSSAGFAPCPPPSPRSPRPMSPTCPRSRA